MKGHWESLTLFLILALALAVRSYGIGFGLPYVGYTHPDEYAVAEGALKMLREGDLDPRHYPGPWLHEYIQYLIGQAALAYKTVQGHQVSPSDILISGGDSRWGGITNLPEYYLWGRFVVALLGTVTVWLVYLLGKEAFSPEIGLISAAFLMCAPIHIAESRSITTAVPGTLFIVLACYFGFLAYKHEQWRYYFLAGLAAGLAIYTKRNGRIALVPLGMLVLLKAQKTKNLGKVFAALLLTCIIAAPFLLSQGVVSLPSLMNYVFSGIWQDSYVFGGSHPGFEGTNTWWWVVTVFLRDNWKLVFLSALGGIVWSLFKYGKKGLFLLAPPLSYYLVFSFFTVRFERWLIPLEPFLALFAGVFLWELTKVLCARAHLQQIRTAIMALLVGLIVFVAKEPMLQILRYYDLLRREPPRTAAAKWIETHIPQGTGIAVEPYGPFVRETSYKVIRVGSLIAHDLAWYLEEGIDYAIATSVWEKFYSNMDKYRAEVNRYEELFDSFYLEQQFGGIRIYRTKPPPLSPADVEGIPHLSNFLYEAKAELIGYALSSEEVRPGETLQVTLYWRALRKLERDYTVSLRLWGRNDQIIGQQDVNRPTSRWEPLDVLAETYHVTVAREALAPSLGRIEVALYDQQAAARLLTYDKDMNRLSHAFIAQIKLSPTEPLQPPKASTEQYNLGNKIALIGYSLDKKALAPGESLRLTLYWKALADMGEDYTVFTHLIDAQNRIWGQEDSQPVDGYYPTSFWEIGEVVEDEYYLPVQPEAPRGGYGIEVGMYVLSTGERLPVLDAKGERLDDRIILGEVSIRQGFR